MPYKITVELFLVLKTMKYVKDDPAGGSREIVETGEIMIFVILGGVGRHFGPLAGAALFILLEHNLGGVSEYWKFLLGLLLLLVVLFAQGGLIGVLTRRSRHG